MTLGTYLILLGGGYGLWTLYMMTFRTRDYLDLMKCEADKKHAKRQAVTGAAKTGIGLALRFLRR